jgi:hypothetical protein
MAYETPVHNAEVGGTERRRGRRASGGRPVQWTAQPVRASEARSDRLQAETSLLGALALVDEGLAAAEESYWRVLEVFESSLGAEHPEVAAVKRRIADAHLSGGGLR